MAEGTAAAAGALSELFIDEDKVHRSLIPDDVVIRDYLSCINDDTWVRHAELVQLSDLKETPHEELVKKEVLRTFIEERRRSGLEVPRDLIMEGILWQERFMEEYKREQRSQDKKEASNYKQSLMSKFRTKRTGVSEVTDSASRGTRAIEYKESQASAPEYPTEDTDARDTYHELRNGNASAVQQDLNNDAHKKEEEEKIEPAAANEFDHEIDIAAEPCPVEDHTEPEQQADEALQQGHSGESKNEYPTEDEFPAGQQSAGTEPAGQAAVPGDVTQAAAEYPSEEGISAEKPSHEGEATAPDTEAPDGTEYPVEDAKTPPNEPAADLADQPATDANADTNAEEM
ncbi:putative Paraflagellar Rod Proteome Component 9 [Trypanosoma cruzi]|nr:putative Paraflagellar Rod Proteome Component 9 [Trypanosoma cruzi]